MNKKLKEFLDEQVENFNQPNFIPDDPISIPHAFQKKQDIEIAGFFAATLAWGQRKTIINKCNELMNMMDRAPHDFVVHHQEEDLKRLLNFKHRTFNATDTLVFVDFLKQHYQNHNSLESAFVMKNPDSMTDALSDFHEYFFASPHAAQRTRKHVATPQRKSACKRLNMFLRWMVRKDSKGVDFGLWNELTPALLICPLDVHVARVAKKTGLLKRRQSDWQAALELTENLRLMDPNDPVKYDFALFGLGVVEKY